MTNLLQNAIPANNFVFSELNESHVYEIYDNNNYCYYNIRSFLQIHSQIL